MVFGFFRKRERENLKRFTQIRKRRRKEEGGSRKGEEKKKKKKRKQGKQE